MEEHRSRSSDADVYAASLTRTLKELQKRVGEHESRLNELRSEQHPLPQTPAGQVRLLATAFATATDSDPFLPQAGSVLPALLALRKTHQTIIESQAFLASQTETSERERRQLDREKAALSDHKVLQQALAARIASLRAELDGSSGDLAQTKREAARRRIEDMAARKKHYGRETAGLMRALHAFIEDHLAAMLAAEELGGPVVGDLMDVDDEDLAGGFNAQGRLKKRKMKEDDKTQRRIDEMWGGRTEEEEQMGQTAAAGAEMRRLTEELLNRLVEARGSSDESYVRLERESAAARFLIRCKVAEFHPRDATKMRLVDFGRELEL